MDHPLEANRLSSEKRPRFGEIDLARGIGVILMVLYHGLFDLVFFEGWSLDLNTGLIWAAGRAAAILFVGLAGLSMTLAWRRKHGQKEKPILERGLRLMGLGIFLTAFTWIAFPDYVIWFGVLHLIGAGMILGILFLERPRAAGIVGGTITLLGIIFSQPGIQEKIPFILPLFPVAIPTFDYFPLFPWIGIFFLGMSIGNWLYPKGKPGFLFTINKKSRINRLLQWAGRHSLSIYFAHQPLIVGILLGIHALAK